VEAARVFIGDTLDAFAKGNDVRSKQVKSNGPHQSWLLSANEIPRLPVIVPDWCMIALT
jgi:hypothetical protein